MEVEGRASVVRGRRASRESVAVNREENMEGKTTRDRTLDHDGGNAMMWKERGNAHTGPPRGYKPVLVMILLEPINICAG